MAQIAKDTYKTIADAYAQIWTYLDGVAGQARVAVDTIVDVTTTGYTPMGAGSADSDAALEIELELLDVFNAAYISVQGIASSSSSLLDAVRAINNMVIVNYAAVGYGGTAQTTPDTKLADYVMSAVWDGALDCIPRGWYELTTDAGYDASSWIGNVCWSA